MFYVEDTKCTGCGACVEACLEGAIIIRDNKASIDQSLCNSCGRCLEVCADKAIYQVTTPVLVSERAPKAVVSRPRMAIKKQVGIGATLVSIAPAAMDVIFGLARRWLAAKGDEAKTPGSRPGNGTGRRRRWRGGQ